jgi:hypothetical protein
MRCYGLSKQERKYEVVSGKPVIAPIKTDNLRRCNDIFVAAACFVNENYTSSLSSRVRLAAFFYHAQESFD